ncbi:NAD(P)H nitroreductase [Gayadomonas joobiniege]|uniref:NAD(P)H nitroreductase n=1 Tax=Gayadomonas joobiniege TaxID=1234606 RepID=UPI00037208AD|nr:NAD(P)H nitroreductase [Gayadomonas joobiniege]
MQALQLLLNRTSYNKLAEPAPTGEALDNIFKAAVAVPDHGALTPYRFIVFKDKALTDLGEIFAEAAEAEQADCEQIEKAKQMPQRAPLVIAVVVSLTPDHKIPESEQRLTAGCAAHAMQMAAVAQGFQGIWRSGAYSYNAHVKQQLKLSENEHIVGFLYLGSAIGEVPEKSRPDVKNYIQYW